MEDVNSAPVEQTKEASSAEVKTNDDNKVSYESFRKSVEAEKNARERARQLEQELEAKNNADLEAQGKHDEIIESYKRKSLELERTLKEEREAALWGNVTSTVKTEALKQGCKNPDKLIKLFDKEDFSMLQTENGQIMPQSLNALMEKAKKENDFLFGGTNVRVNDAVPSTSVPRVKTVGEMTHAEKLNKMKQDLSKALS